MSLNIVVNADVAAAGRQIQDFSKQSRIALTNLSLVAQDLPFGFIGIQNNLPGVIQSFGALRAESGSTLGALKALGSSLVGPAGLFLAFSAVTSAITFAIQKYGSLSNAINALIGSTSALTQQQVLLNKASADAAGNAVVEESKVKILSKTLTDIKQPYKDRLAAYDELRKISPDVVAGIDRENFSSAASIDIINKQVEARLQLLRLKVQEAGINAVLEKNSTDLAVVRQKLAVAQAQEYEFSRKLEMSTKNQGAAALAASQGVNTYAISLNKVRGTISDLEKEEKKLVDVNEQYFNQLKPIVNSTAEINSQTQTLIQNYKDQSKAAKEALRLSIGTITEGVQLGERTIDDDKTLSKVFAANRRIQVLSIKEFTKEHGVYVREYLKNQNAIQNSLTLEDFAEKSNRNFKKQKFEDVGKTILFTEDIYKQFNALDALVKKFEETKQALSAAFFQPLSSLFDNFFSTGKLAIKDFGDALLQQIQRIVAKIIATGIIRLLASILFPGGAQASAGTTGATGIGRVISDVFSSFTRSATGPQIANPSLSGLSGGGLSMNGQVNLILRGSDLVGALNRTNSTINRVG